MSLLVVKVPARWLGPVAYMALALSCGAQQTIQFSKAGEPDPVASANSLLPSSRPSASAISAPTSPLFKSGAPGFDYLPMGPQPIILNGGGQWQKFLDDRKNWSLLTPQEILGVPTPESILGLESAKDDAKLSPEERFLKRQERRSMGGTNSFSRPDSILGRDNGNSDSPWRNLNDDRRTIFDAMGVKAPVDGQNLRPFLGNDPKQLVDVNQGDPTWSSPFGVPMPTAKPTARQLEGMDAFRALLDRPLPAVKPANSIFSQPSTLAHDANMQALPAFNPAGRSYTAVQNGVTKPLGLTPLSGVMLPPPQPKKTSLVQPPPWLSDSPQDNGTFRQRTF